MRIDTTRPSSAPTRLAIALITLALAATGLTWSAPGAAADPPSITTVAGDGTTSCRDEDGNAGTDAHLHQPRGLALHPSGTIWFAEYQRHRIFEIKADGTLLRRAGNACLGGFGGDGGPATSAQLFGPRDIDIDGAGNLFIADTLNDRIRRVDATTGTITTVAGTTDGFSGDGGPATAAQLNSPGGVAVAVNGDLYVADTNNYRLRKVDAATGTISTIAGDGTFNGSGDGGPAADAQIRAPLGVAVDHAGNVFIAQSGSGAIGSGSIRRIDAAAGTISTLVSGVGRPEGITVDGDGNVWVSESQNDVISMIDPSGTRTVVAGNGTAGFSGDGGFPLQAQFDSPEDVVPDGQGQVFVADQGNDRVRRVTLRPPPDVTFSATSIDVREDDGPVAVTVNLAEAAGDTTSVQVVPVGGTATGGMPESGPENGGVDYDDDPVTVTLEAGETTATAEIPLVVDEDVEGHETIDLELQSAVGLTIVQPSATTVHIINDDYPGHGFDDVLPWVDDAVDWITDPANDPPIASGYDDGTYRPDDDINRAQVARMLYRLADAPAVDELPAHGFSDVPPWVEDAVRWLVGTGDPPLATGYDDGTFRPGDPITRAQVVRMLYRFAGAPAVDELPAHGFSDVPAWVEDAVRWANATTDPDTGLNPLVAGYDDGTFRGGDPITRAQVTRMLYRYHLYLLT